MTENDAPRECKHTTGKKVTSSTFARQHEYTTELEARIAALEVFMLMAGFTVLYRVCSLAGGRKMKNELAERLRQAKALISEETWWHGQDYADTLYCPLLAIYAGAGHHRNATALFRKAIGQGFISEWNDAPERTLAEVHAAFDRAIELAEKKVAV